MPVVVTIEKCLVHERSSKGSIKANALEFLQRGESELDGTSPDDVPIERVKLEADSMTAIVLNVFKHNLFSQATEDYAVNMTKREMESYDKEVLEVAGEVTRFVINSAFDLQYTRLGERDEGKDFLARTDHYRDAYYRRSPLSHREERMYESNAEMVKAGFNTLGHQGAVMIHALEHTGINNGLDKDERLSMVKNSGHMLILLSKLSLADFTKYVDLLNNHEEAMYGLARIEELGGQQDASPERIARFHPEIFDAMRYHDNKDRSHLGHRVHTGCVGSVDLDKTGSPLALGWRWLVNVVERAGYWTRES